MHMLHTASTLTNTVRVLGNSQSVNNNANNTNANNVSDENVVPGEIAVQVNLLHPKLDTIPRILQVSLQDKQQHKVVEQGLQQLSNLITQDPNQYQIEALFQGACTIIVMTMKHWQTHFRIQGYACLCLRALTYKNHQAKASAAQAGAVEAILNALVLCSTSKSVQTAGLGALVNIVSGNPTNPKPTQRITQRFVFNYQGIQVVLKSMAAFPHDDYLQRMGCIVLDNISLGTEYHQALFSAGALDVVERIVKEECSDAVLLHHAKRLIQRVSSKEEC